jgi:tRNA(fMet)-specific endonuclease VapC
MVIFDTNILIGLYRGNSLLKEQIENMGAGVYYISSITVAEFLVGARDKAEMQKIKSQLSTYTYLPITAEITDTFLDIFQKYSMSHRPGIADVLIAATALHYNLPVFTLNRKHFQFIDGIKLI